MRTHLDLERISTGRWRLRVRREDPNRITTLAADSVRAWAAADERQARAGKRRAK